MSKYVIYTSVFGDYDWLLEPAQYTRDIDYVCFTNNKKFKSNVWDVRVIEPYMPTDSCRSARHVKICFYKYLRDYEYSMYVDGNMKIKNVPDMERLLDGNSFAIERHTGRCCVYDEAEACKKYGKDNADIIDAQMKIYSDLNYPKRDGLYSTGFHLKKHTDMDLIRCCEAWWLQVLTYSIRDQLSFPFAFHRFPFTKISNRDRDNLVTVTSLHPCPYKEKNNGGTQ